MNKQEKHFLSIKQIYPNATSVVKPVTKGVCHDIYIVESTNNKYICRFSTKAVAEHNLKISRILTEHNISVPMVSIYNCGDYYCETYPFLTGKTLYERLQEGLAGEKLDNVYTQMLDISHKMSNIPHCTDYCVQMSLKKKILHKVITFLNPSKIKLCHTDLHAGNILLNKNDNICAILDLDSIGLEHLSVAYFIIMKDAHSYGYNLKKINAEIQDLNIKNPQLQIKLFSCITKLYKCITLFKQLLKNQVK